MAIKEIPKQRGAVITLGSVLIGLVIARFIMISPFAGIVFLSSAIVVVITVFLRKIDYLIFAWFALTSLIWLFLHSLFPLQYYAFLGRAIFWGLLVCMVAAWAVDNILAGRQFTPFDNLPLKATLLIFLLWCTLSLFTSLDVVKSIKKLSHIVIALVASYMFYDFFSQDEKNIRKVLNIVSLVAIFFSFLIVAIGIHGLVSGVPIYKKIRLWFLNPNILGSLLFICSPLMITSGFDFRPIKRLKLFFVSIVLLALIFSFHRTSWLAILVSIVFLLWKGKPKLLLAPVIIAVLLVGGFTFPIWKGDFYDFISGQEFSGRREVWQAAWNVACEYPVLGTGLGNPGPIDKYIDTPWLKGQQTHSIYLQNAIEMGFTSVVTVFVFYVIFLCFSTKIENNLQSHYLKLAVRGTTATFLGLFVHGIFGNYGILNSFDAAEFHVLFPYVLMALPFAAKKLEEKRELHA